MAMRTMIARFSPLERCRRTFYSLLNVYVPGMGSWRCRVDKVIHSPNR